MRRVSAGGGREGEEGAEMLSEPEGRFHLDWGGFQYFMKALFVKTTRRTTGSPSTLGMVRLRQARDRLQGRSPLHAPVASRERRHLLDSSYMVKGGEIGGFGGG